MSLEAWNVRQVERMTTPSTMSVQECEVPEPEGRLTSITVLFARLAMITHFSSSKATLHTDSAGWLSSRTSWPVFRLQILTRPSLPPLTIRTPSNCRLVTLLSCAANRWTGALAERDHTRTDPSEPPLTRVSPRIWSCPTKEVCPCRIALHAPVLGSHILTLVSKLPVAIFDPSKAIA